MNFTKTVPTKGTPSDDCILAVCHRPGDWISTDGWFVSKRPENGWAASRSIDMHIPIEPPQPVPEDVMEAVNWLRKIAIQKGLLGAWSETTKAAVQKLCDYIDPPKVLPLPRRFRGTYDEEPCVGVEFENGSRRWHCKSGNHFSELPQEDLRITEWIDGEQP